MLKLVDIYPTTDKNISTSDEKYLYNNINDFIENA